MIYTYYVSIYNVNYSDPTAEYLYRPPLPWVYAQVRGHYIPGNALTLIYGLYISHKL